MKNLFTGSFNKKLSSYSLTAIAVLAGTQTVNAQAWGYSPPTTVRIHGGQHFDINFNGNTAFRISLTTPASPKGVSTYSYLITALPGFSGQWIKRSAGGKAKGIASPYVISAGVASRWTTGDKRFAYYSTPSNTTGASFFVSDKYIDVRFKISGSYHYGWIYLHLYNHSNGIKLNSYAYDETAGNSISVGTLPVELTSFTAAENNGKVELNWKTATEVNNYGFEIERNPLQRGVQGWVKVGFVEGNGNSNSPKNYSFLDRNPVNGKAEYRLRQIDNDGAFKYSSIVTVNSLPTKFELSQNYPNPFNPVTTIRYSIPKAENVTLKVYDELGKEVSTLVNENKEAGNYKVTFNGAELTSGIYYYRITAGDFTEVKKLMLLK
jgi:Secretion system C-terminal sorting domain